mgnify:CR=1 FL=1
MTHRSPGRDYSRPLLLALVVVIVLTVTAVGLIYLV